MNPYWQKDFFTGLALDVWRKAVTPEQTRREADFIERWLGQGPGSRWLDVPCGNGRHAMELARRGRSLTGVDLATEYLEEARKASAAERLAVEWIEADMRELGWGPRFDGAYCFGNAFGYFPPEGMDRFLRGVAAALVPGARFVVQTFMAAESLLPLLTEGADYQIADIAFRVDNEYRATESCLQTRCTMQRGEEREVKTFWHWVYTVGEIRRLLQRAGLRTTELFANPEGQPYAVRQPGLWLVAVRE